MPLPRLLTTALTVAGLALAGCVSSTGDRGPGTAPVMMGAGGFHVSRLTCSAPAHPPGRVVAVVLHDMGLSRMMGGTAPMGSRMRLRAVPAGIAAGRVSLVVANRGWRTHEVLVLPLAPHQRAGQRVPGADGEVDESGSLGEASTSCGAGAGDGIRAGTVGWLTLGLAPGRYELLCNLPNHYADGMYQELVVTPA